MSRIERRIQSSVVVWLPAAVALTVVGVLQAGETALDRYVAKPDPTYTWKVTRAVPSNEWTQYIVDLNSQTWRSESEVDRPVRQHWLTIVKPARTVSKIAYLRITGGANGGEPPQAAEVATLKLAKITNSVVAELKMVPNQRQVLHNDGVRLSEDDFIAYTWDRYLKTGADV